ncbi:MAG: hypothetical protein ABJA37_07535 [Ferruginibacter sp.]
MIEIIALFILTRQIGEMARRKGLSILRWKLYLIAAWFVAEIIGFIIAFKLFGKENLLGLMLVGLVSAFGGYLFIRAQLLKMPDSIDDDINRIGQ